MGPGRDWKGAASISSNKIPAEGNLREELKATTVCGRDIR